MLFRRIQKKAITMWSLRPIYGDKASTLLSRSALALRGTRRRALVVAISATVAALLATRGQWPLAIVIGLLGSVVLFQSAYAWFRRRSQIQRIVKGTFSFDGIPSAREALLALGIDDERVTRLIQDSANGEIRIATFDQENRLLSDVGPIPFFGEDQIPADNFRKRSRHTLELVILANVLCVKKSYGTRSSFENEILALDALSGCPGVPRLLSVHNTRPVIYQSFIMGRNVGNMMTHQGASVHLQFQVSVSYQNSDRWHESITSKARDTAVRVFHNVVSDTFLSQAGELMEEIHHRGVTLGDVKYGNLLVVGKTPHLCDFDSASVHTHNDLRFVKERASDRDKFNYFYGGNILSERVMATTVGQLASEKKDLFYAPIYYGHGYQNIAPGSIELGSGKWHFVRPFLPDLRGKSVLDLGCNNGLIPLEMLRAGALRVTAYELNPIVARYARLNHRWYEFIDNKSYSQFRLIEGYMHEACDRDWSGYDIATSFCSLYYEDPEQMARITRTFSKTIDCFVVQANENQKEHSGALLERSSLPFLQTLLRENGYTNQRIIRFSYYDRPLIVATRAAV